MRSAERVMVGDDTGPPPTAPTQWRRPQLRTTTHSRAGAGALPSTCSTASTSGQSAVAATAIKSKGSNLLRRTRISPPRGRVPSAWETGILKPEVEGAPSRSRLSLMTNFPSEERELVHGRRLRDDTPRPPRLFNSHCRCRRATLAPGIRNACRADAQHHRLMQICGAKTMLENIARQCSPSLLLEILRSRPNTLSLQQKPDRVRPHRARELDSRFARQTTNEGDRYNERHPLE